MGMGIAIIIGVGPEAGLGGALCKRFASLGKHVFIAGRTQSKLDAIVSIIEANGGTATAHVTDCTNESQIINLFDTACEAGTVDLALYNAGNNLPGHIIDMESDYFVDAWKTCCFGGFLFGREAIRRMQPNNKGAILFTGASASLRGRAGYGAFNSSKGALRGLAQAMAKEVGPEGLHVGHVVVDGAINGEKIKTRFPEYAERWGEEGMINIEGIVDAFEYLYKQNKSGWTFEVDIRTSIEQW
jgi:NAD(P)-dependent dehydrogenase (short-subunit alcohol dehydrogenase family)